MHFRITLLFFFILSFILGCKENSTEPQNSPPNIEQIILNPSSTTPGNIVKLSCVVTDKEGDPIQYTWVPSKGSVSQANVPSPDWFIPADVTPYSDITITLNVTDGKKSSSRSGDLRIEKGISIQGFVYYSSTTIPVSGATVTIGYTSKTTSNDGKYVLDNIPSGKNTVKVIKTGYDTYETSIDVSSSNTKFNFPITSSTETKKLYGTIKTVDNIKLNGIRISVLNPDNTESGLTEVSDANGNYQIASVPQGTRKIKLKNVSNSIDCKESVQEVFLANFDKNLDPRMKILRQGNYINSNSLWETNNNNIVYSYNGNWIISSTVVGKIKLNYKISIPTDAEDYSIHLYARILEGLFVDYYYIGPNLVPYKGAPLFTLTDYGSWDLISTQWFANYENTEVDFSFSNIDLLGKNKALCIVFDTWNRPLQKVSIRSFEYKYYW